jgi:menaquinone-9 beta-reductase
MNATPTVLIAGGGLAGATTALLLGRAGVRCVVVDKASFPRDKPCGEGLLPHGVETLQSMGVGHLIDLAAAQSFVGIRYHCGGVVADGDFVEGVGRGVRRRVLDEGMRSSAASVGAAFVQGHVDTASEDKHGVQLRLRDGTTLRGDVLVGADGPRSVVRHSLGLDGGVKPGGRYALRQHFKLAQDVDMPKRVEVHMGVGYELYLTPCAPGVVGLAALVAHERMRSDVGPPAQRLQTLVGGVPLIAERLRGSEAVTDAMTCGPLRVRARAVHTNRTVLVGDAAGYVDAITGEGMSLALKTARAAAAAIEQRVQGNARAFSVYRTQRRRLFFDHAVLTHGLVWLAQHPRLAERAIARLAHEPALFGRLLSVNNGTKPLWHLSPLDLIKLAVGKSPHRMRAQLGNGAKVVPLELQAP